MIVIGSAPHVNIWEEKEPLRWDLTESRIDANRLLRILEGLGQRNELGVRERAVVVPTRVARVALNTLRITFHCAGKVALLEQPVSLFARGGRQCRVNVRSAVRVRLYALCILELIQDFRRAMFCKGFFKEANCGSQVFLLGVGGPDATVRFCDEFVIRAELGSTPHELVSW